MSLETVEVSPIPDWDFHGFRQEVLALPPSKQAKWHSRIQDTNGVVRRVQFVGGNFVYKNQSQWVMVLPMTEVQMRTDFGDIYFEEPRSADHYRRATNAFDRGGVEEAEQEMNRIVNEAATGNHQSKTHRVKVPTAAGEPVRG